MQPCECGCGELANNRFIHGHNRSNLKHGKRTSPEYQSYYSAKGRCERKSHPRYKDWGGRGIKFLFNSFEEFYREVGPRPSTKYRLDREDNDGNYEPGNVRWVTTSISTLNQRKSSRNKSKFRGVSFVKREGRWVTYIKDQFLGYYETAKEAALAYDSKAREMFGKDAKLNFLS